MPVTRSSTSVLTTGAGPGAGCSAVRQNSVPSLMRVPFAGAAGTGRAEATMSSRSSATLVLIVLIGRLGLDASGLVVRVANALTALGAHRAYGRGGGVGELPDLDVDPAVELLAFPTGCVADRAVGPDGRDLHARIGHAQLDEELFDRLGALPGQQLVVRGRALTVGVALDEDRPRAGLLPEGGLVLEQVHGLGGETGTLEVEVDRSEEHTSELQSRPHLVCRLLLEKKKNKHTAQADPIREMIRKIRKVAQKDETLTAR